jgi:hypothetical protein
MKNGGFFLVLCVLGVMAFAQEKKVTDTNALPKMTDIGMLNTNTYAGHFGFTNGEIKVSSRYVYSAPRVDQGTFGLLGGREAVVDTPLEFALLSYYSQPILDVRPVQADAVLPRNNPKLADLKLGAAVLQEIKILGFLGNRDAVGRHEGILKFITDRGNVTRAEIETFYRQNVGASIAAEVDTQLNRRERSISASVLADIKQVITNFFIAPSQTSYNALLSAHNHYFGNGAILITDTLVNLNPALAHAVLYNENPAGVR